jgi:hypothetical protein
MDALRKQNSFISFLKFSLSLFVICFVRFIINYYKLLADEK